MGFFVVQTGLGAVCVLLREAAMLFHVEMADLTQRVVTFFFPGDCCCVMESRSCGSVLQRYSCGYVCECHFAIVSGSAAKGCSYPSG